VCTWDDHEFSNNGYQDFNAYEEPHFRDPRRKRDANRAWFEFIPARIERRDDLQIYRSLKWGRTADILVTDLRSYRSPPRLPEDLSTELGLPVDPVELVAIYDGGKAYNGGNPPEYLPFGDGTHPNTARTEAPATMLGEAQKNWFKQHLSDSTAHWKIWANSLPALPLRLDLSSIPFQDLPDGILTADAWAGYPGELRELMHYVHKANITGLVSLSGDHHMHGAGTLAVDPDAAPGNAVALDFNVAGISSSTHLHNVLAADDDVDPLFRALVETDIDGETVPVWNLTLTRGVLAGLAFSRTHWEALSDWLGPNPANPGLAYVDAGAHGFGVARFVPERCDVDLVTVASAEQEYPSPGSPVTHRASFSVPAWEPETGPQLPGPQLDTDPGFPV
jgi:alkaline phosphatase D